MLLHSACLHKHCRLEKGYVPLNPESRGNRSHLKRLLRDHYIYILISEHQLWFQRAKKVSHLKGKITPWWLGKGHHRFFFFFPYTPVALYLLHNFFFFLFVFFYPYPLLVSILLFIPSKAFGVGDQGEDLSNTESNQPFNPLRDEQKTDMSFLQMC